MNKIVVPCLTFVGCALLAFGNTSPWPCNPGVWHSILCDASLDVWFVDELIVGVFIAVITMMLMLEVNFSQPPLSTLAWASYWIILYFLLVAKLRTDTTFPSFHFTLVHFTRNLVTLAITPLSLVSYWLVLRPKHLKQKFRILTLLCLSALTLIAVFFLLFAMSALDLQAHYSFQVKEALKSAPIIILAGTLLLLGAEIVDGRFIRFEDLFDHFDDETDPEQAEANLNRIEQ